MEHGSGTFENLQNLIRARNNRINKITEIADRFGDLGLFLYNSYRKSFANLFFSSFSNREAMYGRSRSLRFR